MKDIVLFLKQEVHFSVNSDLVPLFKEPDSYYSPANPFEFQVVKKQEGVSPISEKQRLFLKSPPDLHLELN